MSAQVLDLAGAIDSDSGGSGLGAAAVGDQRWGGHAGAHRRAESARPGAALALPASLLPEDADAWLFSAAPAAALPPPLQGAGSQNPELEGRVGPALGAQNSPRAEPGSALCGSIHPGAAPGGAMFANTLPPPACDNAAAPPPTAVSENALPPLTCDSADASPAAALFANALPPPARDDVALRPTAPTFACALPSPAWDGAAAAPGGALFADVLPPLTGPQGPISPPASSTRRGDRPNQAGAIGPAGSHASADTASVDGKPAEAIADAAGRGEPDESGARRMGGAWPASEPGPVPGPRAARGARRGLRFDDPAPPAFALPGAPRAAAGTSPNSAAAAAARQGGAACADAPEPGGGSPSSAASASAEGGARPPHTPGAVPGKGASAAGPVRTPAPVSFTPARSVVQRGADPDLDIEEQVPPGSPHSWGVRLKCLGSQGLPISRPATPPAGPELGSGSEDPAGPPPASSAWLGPAGLAGALRGSPSAGIARRWLQAAGAAGAGSPAGGTLKPFPGGRLRDAAPSARLEPYRPAALAGMWRRAASLPREPALQYTEFVCRCSRACTSQRCFRHSPPRTGYFK